MNQVYKYTKYRKDFFENFQLKLSRFGEFNDPFEMMPGDFLLTLPQTELATIFTQHPLLSDPDHHLECYQNVSAGVRASLGVICFSGRSDSLLMWSHYADNHNGICIEFDTQSNFFKKENLEEYQFFLSVKTSSEDASLWKLREVTYNKNRPLFIDPAELEHETESWFIKSDEWAYEKELRALIPLTNAIHRDDMFFCSINRDNVKAVTLGCQMDIMKKKEIFLRCSELGIAVKESFIHSTKYELDIIDYHPSNHASHINYYNFAKNTKY
jgi:hypothetical protein